MKSGSADCAAATTPPTGPGAGPGGGGFIGMEGSYCADNWMWDAGCSGPNDGYVPMSGFGGIY